MKKILLGIIALLLCTSVYASVGENTQNIKIEDIKVTTDENIGYNETAKIEYVINPLDTGNANLVWSITGLKSGITANFTNGNETKEVRGTITLEVKNTLDNDVTLKLIAKQNGNILSTTELKIETKENTITRVTGEVKELILSLDERFNKNNYEENREKLDTVEEELKNNKEIEELIEEDLMTKYNDAKDLMTTYEESQGKTFTIVVSIVLVAIFVVGMFLIFKKEEN